MYQILEHDYQNGIRFFKNWNNIKIVPPNSNIENSIPIIIGSDVQNKFVRKLMNDNFPAIYIGRGYLGNHNYKTRKFWRYSVNGWANTKLLDVPYSRWNSMNLERHPWKVKKIENVLIAPSKATQKIWDPDLPQPWYEYMSTKFPGANIKIRYKPRKSGLRWGSLFQDLDWADLVVAQGSAITTEAFWYGKKVISTHPCPTWAAEKTTLEDWKNPEEPKLRDAWHEHIAWCQFRNDEWESGEAIDMIEQYIGPINLYQSSYNYKFK